MNGLIDRLPVGTRSTVDELADPPYALSSQGAKEVITVSFTGSSSRADKRLDRQCALFAHAARQMNRWFTHVGASNKADDWRVRPFAYR